jgi:hypothetical protein
MVGKNTKSAASPVPDLRPGETKLEAARKDCKQGFAAVFGKRQTTILRPIRSARLLRPNDDFRKKYDGLKFAKQA